MDKCFNAVINDDCLYCPNCGEPLAKLGLPKAGQINLFDADEDKSNVVSYNVKIENLGYVPLHIAFKDIPSGVSVIPAETTILPAYPDLTEMGQDIDIPHKEFKVSINTEKCVGLTMLPITTNAVEWNQPNLDEPMLVYIPKDYYNDTEFVEEADSGEDDNNQETANIIKFDDNDGNKVRYTPDGYSDSGIAYSKKIIFHYKNLTNKCVNIKFQGEPEEKYKIDNFDMWVYGKQEGNITLNIHFLKPISEDLDFSEENRISVWVKYHNDKNPRELKLPEFSFTLNPPPNYETTFIDFGYVIPNQIVVKSSKVRVKDFEGSIQLSQEITYSNECVKLASKLSSIGSEDTSLKFLFSTRWVKDTSCFFEGENKLNGTIILHALSKDMPDIVISWRATVLGIAEQEGILALDFGTVNSCLAVFEGGEAKVVKSELSFSKNDKDSVDGITPSILAFLNKDLFVVGNEALPEIKLNSENVVSSIKRCILDDNREFFGKSYSPVELASYMIEQLLLDAVCLRRCYPKKIVLSLPANFWGPLKDKISEAFDMAWSNMPEIIQKNSSKEMIDEPTASAIYYVSKNIDFLGKLLVFDFGGGTLDVSVIKVEQKPNSGAKIIEPMLARGDNELGGIDIDYALLKHLAEDINNKKDGTYEFKTEIITRGKKKFKLFQQAMEKDAYSEACNARSKWNENCKTIKEYLSDHTSLKDLDKEFREFPLPSALNEDVYLWSGAKDNRTQFEGYIREQIDRIEAFVKRCLKALNLKSSDISKVLLTGQSSKIPIVKQRLKEIFGGNKVCGYSEDMIEIKTCVAKGAAIAGYYKGSSDLLEIVELNKTSYRYGIVLPDVIGKERFVEMIPNGTAFDYFSKPTTVNQLDIDITQNESDVDVYNTANRKREGVKLLGKASLHDCEKTDGGYRLQMSFSKEDARAEITANDKQVNINYVNEADDTYI